VNQRDLAHAPDQMPAPNSEAAPARRPWRAPIAAKLAAALIGLVVLVLLVNSAINTWLSYNQAKDAALEVQREKARSAAIRVGEFLGDIETQLGWTTGAEWRHAQPEQRRYDFVRLLRQVPAITELSYLDGEGKEQLKVSRLEPDSIGSAKDFSSDPRFVQAVADKVWFGPVEFRRGSEPYMTIALSHVGKQPGVTLADVNLKLIWDVVNAIRVGEKGYAFIVDGKGRLIAHPDLSLVLRGTDFSALPQVKEALDDKSAAEPAASTSAAPRVGTAEIATGFDGDSVLTAYSISPATHWIVFVQLPLVEALASVYKSLYQTLALLGLGLLLALVVGGLLARRLVAPIRRLQYGAERLGAGDLSQRLDIRTGDEIETLADRFNQMAGSIKESHDTLEAKVETRTLDLNEALRLQIATAEVLKVISRSAFDLQNVFNTLIASAVDLCEAHSGTICVRDGGVFRYRGSAGGDVSEPLAEYLADHPATPGRGSMVGRVLLSGKVETIPDRLKDPDFAVPMDAYGNAARALLGVPLLGKTGIEGALVLTRKEPGPFSDRRVEIVQTFADQAVIAIENSGLFEQVQARTRELSVSLDELRKAQDRLVQSEKLASLGQLTAGIAHEIKNPLNFVNNFSALSRELLDELRELLAKAKLTQGEREEANELIGVLASNLDKVVTHGRRADSIVKNMLLHSREGSGERTSVYVNPMVEEALNLAYHGARAEKPGFNVTIAKSLDPEAGAAEIYAQEITRVLLNLISNGFYATTKRRLSEANGAYEPTISASTRDLGDRIEIAVRDNGTGIPEEVKAKMFNPFFTTKPAGEGTGLGLSLSHDIVVKQHGGTIEVATEPGAFTQFTIVLPRKGAAR
jgi:signal transduction histidine kinase/HAMP domain-containing protein